MTSIQRNPVVAFLYGQESARRTEEIGRELNTAILHSREINCREELIAKVMKCFNVLVSVLEEIGEDEPFSDPAWKESLSLSIPHASFLYVKLGENAVEQLRKVINPSPSPCIFTQFSLENLDFNRYMRSLKLRLDENAPPGEQFDEIQQLMPYNRSLLTQSTVFFKNIDVSCPDFIASVTPQLYAEPYFFWKKIWDNSSVVVQLNEECDYLSEAIQHVHDLVITLGTKESRKEGAVTETLIILQKEGERKEVTHLLINKWIDGEAYKDPSVLDYVIDRVKGFADLDFTMLPLVHCTAGVGRTGTFLAAYFKRHLLVHHPLQRVEIDSFASDITLFLRLYRSGAIFTVPQYLFLDSYEPKKQ